MSCRWIPLIALGIATSMSCSDDVTSYSTEGEVLIPQHHGSGYGFSENEQVGKSARRLSVDNLRQSIPMLMGGNTWTAGSREVFDRLSRTLGEADYLEVTESNTEPNPLFAKFMDDMAGQVCDKAVRSDAEEGTQIIIRDDDVYDNLRFLRLKLHGIYVPPDSEEGLAGLKSLYDDIFSEIQNEHQSWYGVCVAMLTAPEFLTY